MIDQRICKAFDIQPEHLLAGLFRKRKKEGWPPQQRDYFPATTPVRCANRGR
jgi:hypothetical protein